MSVIYPLPGFSYEDRTNLQSFPAIPDRSTDTEFWHEGIRHEYAASDAQGRVVFAWATGFSRIASFAWAALDTSDADILLDYVEKQRVLFYPDATQVDTRYLVMFTDQRLQLNQVNSFISLDFTIREIP